MQCLLGEVQELVAVQPDLHVVAEVRQDRGLHNTRITDEFDTQRTGSSAA